MFDGFPPEALAFYEGLSKDNSKRYWQEQPALARIRRAIDEKKRGAELQRIAAALDEEGMPLHEPELKTAPRGFSMAQATR